jgi:hypothetical protein
VSVQALCTDNSDDVIGSFTDTQGNTDGFFYGAQFESDTIVDDPKARGMTVVNGMNDKGQFVAFCLGAAGISNGMLVQIARPPLNW